MKKKNYHGSFHFNQKHKKQRLPRKEKKELKKIGTRYNYNQFIFGTLGINKKIIRKRLNTLEEFKELENPTLKSNFRKYDGTRTNFYWTLLPIIILTQRGETVVCNKWFINNLKELI